MSHESQTRRKAESLGEEAEEVVYNAAQEARGAAGDDPKKLVDTADVYGGETWDNASGHSGTRAAWLASGTIIAGFALGGAGLTFGPRVLLWIGTAVAVAVGVIGLSTHVWSDYQNKR
jgi:hypothetical protein